MNNETPETEAMRFWSDTGGWVVPANFARKLERERDEARLAYKHAVESENRIYKERDQLREQNQTLRNAQKACEDCDAPTAEEVKQLREVADELAQSCEKIGYVSCQYADSIKAAERALASYNNLPHKKGQP